MITETLMRPGSGSIRLKPDTPTGISRAIFDLVEDEGCHVVITPVRMDRGAADADILAAALYTGRVVARPSKYQLDMLGLSSWLDTVMDAAVSRTSGTPTQWLGDLLLNGLSTGTVTGGSNVSRSFPAYAQTHREALDAVASLGGWEYEVRPDFTVDAGTVANVFESPPRVVITDKSEGPDGAYIGLLGGLLDQDLDASGMATKVVAVGSGVGSSIAIGTATQSIPLKTQSGGTPELVAVISAPTEPDANLATVATTVAGAAAAPRKTSTVSTAPPTSFGAFGFFDTGPGRGVTVGSGPTRSPVTGGIRDGNGGTKPGDPTNNIPSPNKPAPYNPKALAELGPTANAAARSTLNLLRAGSGVSASSQSQFVRRYLRPGDEVYIHDIAAGLTDTANEIVYRGETINPLNVRVLSMTWPVEQGYGVYVRSNAASPVYIDLTPYVEYEPSGAFIDVGERSAGSYSTASRSNPSLEQRIAGDAGAWQTITLASANWTATRTPQWRYEGDRVVMRGAIERTTSNLAAPGTIFTFAASGNPPAPTTALLWPLGRDVGAGSIVWSGGLSADISGSPDLMRTAAASPTVAIGDTVYLDHVSWPVT